MANYNGLTKIQMHARLTSAHSGPGSLQTYDLVDSRAVHKIELDSQNPNKLLIKNYASTTLGSIDLPITTIAVEEIQFDGTNEDFSLPAGTSLPEMGKGKLYIITGGGGDTGTHPYTFRPNNNYSIYYDGTSVDYVCTTKRYLAYIEKDTLTHYNVYFMNYPCYDLPAGTNPVNTEAKLIHYIASLGIVKYESSDNTTAFFKMYGTGYNAEDEPYEAEITISQKTYFYVDGHYMTIATSADDFTDIPVEKIVLNTDHDTNFNRIISAEIAVECGFIEQKPYRLFTTDGTTYPVPSPGIQSASYVVIIGRYYKC